MLSKKILARSKCKTKRTNKSINRKARKKLTSKKTFKKTFKKKVHLLGGGQKILRDFEFNREFLQIFLENLKDIKTQLNLNNLTKDPEYYLTSILFMYRLYDTTKDAEEKSLIPIPEEHIHLMLNDGLLDLVEDKNVKNDNILKRTYRLKEEVKEKLNKFLLPKKADIIIRYIHKITHKKPTGYYTAEPIVNNINKILYFDTNQVLKKDKKPGFFQKLISRKEKPVEEKNDYQFLNNMQDGDKEDIYNLFLRKSISNQKIKNYFPNMKEYFTDEGDNKFKLNTKNNTELSKIICITCKFESFINPTPNSNSSADTDKDLCGVC